MLQSEEQQSLWHKLPRLPFGIEKALNSAAGCLTASTRLPLGGVLTGLRFFSGLLLVHALAAAITLTYNFLPYTVIDNGCAHSPARRTHARPLGRLCRSNYPALVD